MRQETLNAKSCLYLITMVYFLRIFKGFVGYKLRFIKLLFLKGELVLESLKTIVSTGMSKKCCFRLFSYKNAKRQTVYHWIQQTSLEPSGRHFVWWVWQFEVGYNTFSCTCRKQKPSWNAAIKINKPESKTSKVGDV